MYWNKYFVVCRVDDLYRFIHAWVPALYGELDENYWREKGYILSDTDTDLSPELSPQDAAETGEPTEGKGTTEEITELTRESWEVSHKVIELLPAVPTLCDSRFIEQCDYDYSANIFCSSFFSSFLITVNRNSSTQRVNERFIY